MFLGYQNNNETGAEFIAYASNTREMFDQYIMAKGERKYIYPTIRVVETEEPCELINGKYYLGHTSIANARSENKSSEVRAKRKELLEEADLWMLIDRYNALSSEKQIELTTYRQNLRDITSQSGFPFDVVFPTKPTWFNPEN